MHHTIQEALDVLLENTEMNLEVVMLLSIQVVVLRSHRNRRRLVFFFGILGKKIIVESNFMQS